MPSQNPEELLWTFTRFFSRQLRNCSVRRQLGAKEGQQRKSARCQASCDPRNAREAHQPGDANDSDDPQIRQTLHTSVGGSVLGCRPFSPWIEVTFKAEQNSNIFKCIQVSAYIKVNVIWRKTCVSLAHGCSWWQLKYAPGDHRMAMSVGHLNQGLENGTAHNQQVHAVPGPTFSLEEESRSSAAKWKFTKTVIEDSCILIPSGQDVAHCCI
jgi:hypothetical protein